MLVATVFLGTLAVALLYWYLTRNFNYWKKKGISNSKPSIIFGSMADTFLGKKNAGEIFNDLYEKFPDKKVVGWFNLQTPGILVRDPELIRKVLVTDFHYFRNNEFTVYEDVDPIFGQNIFTLKDEKWKRGRALITPAFTAGKIKAMFPQMMQVAKDLVTYLKDHPEEQHVKSVLSRYTSEIVARCALGIEGNNFKEPKPMMHELGKSLFEPSPGKKLKFLCFILMPKLGKFLRLKLVSDKITKFFQDVLLDVIVHRQKNNIEKNDLVQYFIEIKKKSLEVAKGNIESETVAKNYSDEDVLSGCVTFFLEGYETSALTLNNVLYFLALHPDVQERLRIEIDETLNEGELTFDKLHGMSYLSCVYQESHRLLPVMFNLQKVCTEKYNMDIGEDKPLVIEKDTTVVVPLLGIQNDSKYWEEPKLFNPERFANKEDAQAKAKGIYLPFGEGPRMCPGYRIATTIVKLGIVQIVANLNILPTSKTPQKIQFDPNYFLVAHKGGIYLRFAERSG